MLQIPGLIIGATWGGWTARRRGGNRLDVLHYGAVFGLVGFVLGTCAMLVIPPPG
ncbi:MAG: hypothetical protein GDA52_02525 [Rhodobacteraceae bacterium]|nr:hypothetical protein [Paracoccaceae bacterium]